MPVFILWWREMEKFHEQICGEHFGMAIFCLDTMFCYLVRIGGCCRRGSLAWGTHPARSNERTRPLTPHDGKSRRRQR